VRFAVIPDAVQRASGAPLIRDRDASAENDTVSAERYEAPRRARDDKASSSNAR